MIKLLKLFSLKLITLKILDRMLRYAKFKNKLCTVKTKVKQYFFKTNFAVEIYPIIDSKMFSVRDT